MNGFLKLTIFSILIFSDFLYSLGENSNGVNNLILKIYFRINLLGFSKLSIH